MVFADGPMAGNTLASAGLCGLISFSSASNCSLDITPGPNWNGQNNGSAKITFTGAVSTASFMLES